MNKEEELKRVLNEFPAYLEYVFKHINLPRPTDAQLRIAEILGANPKRLILEAFRGVGKTWITAAYSTWRLLRNPEEKILIVSASGGKADEISQFARSLFNVVPLLQHLRPRSDQRDSIVAFDVNGCNVAVAPSVKSIGITGQLTGSRGSLIILDDVEVPNNSATETMRAKLIDSVREVEALLIPDMPSSVICLGTPQSIESIYNKMSYTTTIIPAQVPEDPHLYEGKLDDWVLTRGKPGDAVDPQRFDLAELQERKAGYGRTGYNLQFMLDTTLSDAERFPLKVKDCMVMSLDSTEAPLTVQYSSENRYAVEGLINVGFSGDYYMSPMRVNSQYGKYDFIGMSIDPSGRGTDETTWAIVGVLNGNVYVLDVGGTRLGYSDEALILLANKAKEYKVNEIYPEDNFGDGMWVSLFTPILASIYPCTITPVKNHTQKEVRIIDTIEPLSSNHKLIFSRDLIERDIADGSKDPTKLIYSLMYQFTHITRDRGSLIHDDRLDALAIILAQVKDMVMVNPEEMAKRFKENQKEALMDRIMANASKAWGSNKRSNFISKLKRN